MAVSGETNDSVPCALYLIVDVAGASIAEDWWSSVLTTVPVSCVLMVTEGTAATGDSTLKAAISAAQDLGVAVLVDDSPDLAIELSADGVHLTLDDDQQAAYEQARHVIADGIVGVAPGSSRHAAMQLAELGADYIAFGRDAGPGGNAEQLAHIAWWAEIFEVPCVALDVVTPDDANALAAVGADFVAPRISLQEAAEEVRTRLQDIFNAISAG